MATDIKQLSTKSYHLFVFNDFNRVAVDGEDVNPRKDLVASMRKFGFRKTNPIVCVPVQGGRFKIIDGHNRFVAAQSLNLPVEYIAYPKAHEISSLEYSVGQKAWGMSEIARGYAQQGLPDYAEVVDYADQIGINAKDAFSLFRGELATSNNYNNAIRDGSYVITDRESPWKLATLYLRIKRVTNDVASATLFRALNRCMYAEGFDAETLVSRIEKNPRMLMRCYTIDDCVAMLEEVYNRSRKTAKYYLAVEIEKAMTRRQNFKDKAARNVAAKMIEKAKVGRQTHKERV